MEGDDHVGISDTRDDSLLFDVAKETVVGEEALDEEGVAREQTGKERNPPRKSALAQLAQVL